MISINKLISKHCNFICTYAEINDDYLIAKVNYGLQCLYLDGSKFLLLLLLFNCLNSLDCFLVLILLLIPRSLLGGSHCKTYFSCLVFSLTYALSLLLISNIYNLHNLFLEILLLIILSYFVLKKKYIQNPFRPKKSQNKLKKQRVCALCIIYLFLLVSYLFLNEKLFIFGFLITVTILSDFILRIDNYEKEI